MTGGQQQDWRAAAGEGSDGNQDGLEEPQLGSGELKERCGVGQRTVITVPHATNTLPHWLQNALLTPDLGAVLSTHHAIDRGALELATAMGEMLGARVVAGSVSRIAIDLNRDASDSSLIIKSVKGFGDLQINLDIAPGDAAARLKIYAAFHNTIEDAVRHAAAHGVTAFLVDQHAFDRYGDCAVRREVDIGICAPGNTVFADTLLKALNARTTPRPADAPPSTLRRQLNVRRDEPYSAAHPGAHVTRRHSADGVLGVVIEVCDDLLNQPADIASIAVLLAASIEEAVMAIDCGSNCTEEGNDDREAAE